MPKKTISNPKTFERLMRMRELGRGLGLYGGASWKFQKDTPRRMSGSILMLMVVSCE
jgi:hypothetical protein